MKVHVRAFARLRELLGEHRELELAEGATVKTVWDALSPVAGLRELADSTRTARNGRIVDRDQQLSDGDEVALLPPVGGG